MSRRRAAGAVLAMAVTAPLAAGVAYVVIAQLAFGEGLILPVVVPLIGLGFALVGSLAVHWMTASVERTVGPVVKPRPSQDTEDVNARVDPR